MLYSQIMSNKSSTAQENKFLKVCGFFYRLEFFWCWVVCFFLSLLTLVLAVLYDVSLYTRQHTSTAVLEAVTFYGCSLRIPPEQQIFVWMG